MASLDERPVRRLAERLPDQLLDRLGTERPRLKHGRQRLISKLQQLLSRHVLARTARQREAQRKLGDPGSQVGAKTQRRRVRPVGVVDHEDLRASLRGIGAQPVKAVENGERATARVDPTRRLAARYGVRRRLELEHGPRQLRRTREQVLALGRRGSCEQRLQQLAHYPVRKLALQL